jgi:ribosome-binding protein aMBF1 (putative translation factor)
MQLTGIQCKMARAALNWGIKELAEEAGINPNTIVRFESGKGALTSTVDKVLEAFIEHGVTFNENGCVCPPAKEPVQKKTKKK